MRLLYALYIAKSFVYLLFRLNVDTVFQSNKVKQKPTKYQQNFN